MPHSSLPALHVPQQSPQLPHSGGVALDQYSPPSGTYPSWPMLPNARHNGNIDPYSSYACYAPQPNTTNISTPMGTPLNMPLSHQLNTQLPTPLATPTIGTSGGQMMDQIPDYQLTPLPAVDKNLPLDSAQTTQLNHIPGSSLTPPTPSDTTSGMWMGNNLAHLRRKAFEHQFQGMPSFRV